MTAGKWNRIEHRLFSFISKNWRGEPLVSYEVVIKLITATTTRTGLLVSVRPDQTAYPDSVPVSDQQSPRSTSTPTRSTSERGYTIKPSTHYATVP